MSHNLLRTFVLASRNKSAGPKTRWTAVFANRRSRDLVHAMALHHHASEAQTRMCDRAGGYRDIFNIGRRCRGDRQNNGARQKKRRLPFAAWRPRARAAGSASRHCNITGASTMTSTGYGAMPSARMWLCARCSLQIGAPGHFTSAGLQRWFSTQQIAQHDSGPSRSWLLPFFGAAPRHLRQDGSESLIVDDQHQLQARAAQHLAEALPAELPRPSGI
jgi:hypothetical protein